MIPLQLYEIKLEKKQTIYFKDSRNYCYSIKFTCIDKDKTANAHLDSALCCNNAVHRRFSKRVKAAVRSSHEVGLQQVATVAVVLELALI